MPLSEHEQRLLSQLEENLKNDDPRFASTMRGPATARPSMQRTIIGAVAVVVGLAGIIAAVMLKQVFLGVPAFAVMAAGVVYALTKSRSGSPLGVVTSDGNVSRRPRTSARKPPGSFMQRMEMRWDRRRDEGWQ